MVTNHFFARRENYPREHRFALPVLLVALRGAAIPLVIPIIVVGGLIAGIFTPTEAAAIGVVASLLFGFALREITASTLWRLLVTTTYQNAAVLLIVAAYAILAQGLANEQVQQRLAAAMGDVASSPALLLLYINVLLLICGMFLQATAAIIVVIAVLVPVCASFGIDPVHFGIITCVNLAIGQQTPPVATVLMTICSISGTRMHETVPHMKWYLAAMFLALAVVTYLPLIVAAI